MESTAMHEANHILLVAGIILAAGSLSGIVARRFRAPDVVLFLLAGILLGMKVPGAEVIASVTFLAILITILLQATTTRWLAGRLGLLEEQ